MLVGRQTSIMIVRCAEIFLVDASGSEAAMPHQRLSIRRRAGDRCERAGGRAENRRGRIGAGHRGRHAEGGLVVAGCALGHAALMNRLVRSHRRVLLALQHLDDGLVGGFQGITRQQRALVVYGHGDLPDVGGLLEGRGTAAAISDSATDGVLAIGFHLDRTCRFLVCLVLRRDHRQLRARQVARHSVLVAAQHETFVEPSENAGKFRGKYMNRVGQNSGCKLFFAF